MVPLFEEKSALESTFGLVKEIKTLEMWAMIEHQELSLYIVQCDPKFPRYELTTILIYTVHSGQTAVYGIYRNNTLICYIITDNLSSFNANRYSYFLKTHQ